MKTAWTLVALVGVVLGCGWFACQHRGSAAPAPAVPDVAAPPVGDTRTAEPMTKTERSVVSPAAPIPATKAPTAASATAHELTVEELRALEVETPPGVIEGIVLRGRDPITTGGLVYFRRGYFARIREDPRSATAQDKLESTSIDGGGKFRIVGLDLGDYTLALDLGSGAEQETTVRLVEKKPGRRVVIVLGSATVKGHVYDLQGNPVAGARVEVSAETSRLGARTFNTARATVADGSYVISNVPAGPGWFTVLLSGDWTTRETDLMQRITIASGEVRILDFGAPEPAKKWTGTLRTSNGDVVRGGGRLHLSRTDTKAYSEAKILDDGTFSVLIRPGEYSLEVDLNSNWGQRIGFAPIRIETDDLDHDLTIPGTRVSGVVIDESTGLPVESRFKLRIGMRVRDSTVGGPSASVDDSGHFAVDGIEPGVWLVSSFPAKLVEGDHEITVSKQDVEIPLRLTVRTR